MCVSVVPLNWVFDLIFSTHCLPRAPPLPHPHILLYLNFLPTLSLCMPLSLCVFETDKAWCFRLERNGWFCWVGNDGFFLWSLPWQQQQRFLSQQGSVEQRRNSGDLVWSMFDSTGGWLEEFHLCVSVILFCVLPLSLWISLTVS